MDVGPLANVGISAGILAVLLIAFAAKALKTIPDSMRKTPWLVGLIGGALIAVLGPEQTWWLPVAVGLGCTIHLLGDILTTEGINLVWPDLIKAPKILHGVPVLNKIWKPNGFLALPMLDSAGSVREYLVLVPVSIYVVAVTVLTLAAAL
jgi:hypothetical protein